MRLTPSISAMTAEQIMRKKPFSVPIPPDELKSTLLNPGAIVTLPSDVIKYEQRSQADFLLEYNTSSHKINTIKYYPNTMYVNKETGAYQAKVRSRISIGYQNRILVKRKESLLGNNVGMKLISDATKQKNIDLLAFYREGWEERDMEVIVDKAIETDYMTGDTAVYVFMDDGKVNSRVFSYKDGDVLYPHYDSLTGELALLGRAYRQEDWDGQDTLYLDVVDKNYFVTYKQNDNAAWEMEGEPVPHGFPYCPVAYHRSDGPVWSNSQSLIDGYEVAISQFSENNAAYALRILYTLGGEMDIYTNTDGTPNRIDSVDPNAKVGFLEPAQGADGAFATQLGIMEKNIMRCSFAVETPEIKSGADMSSRTVKMLFADSYVKALADSLEYQPFLNRIAYLFKFGYFMEKNKVSNANSFKVKCYLDPFIFLSENDVIAAIQQLVAAGAMSRKTATEIAYNIGYSSPDEIARIAQEAHDELVAESQAQAQVQKTNNPVAASRSTNA